MLSLRSYAVVSAVFAVGVVSLQPVAAHAATSQSFTADGTFAVPSGVTSLSVLVAGAGGGKYLSTSTVDGGVGGITTAVLSVTPGTVLTVQVGGLGATGTSSVGTGGTHGGGSGGGGSGAFGEDQNGGGGGGYSAVLSGSTVLALAGGGGGASMQFVGGAAGLQPSGNGAAGLGSGPGLGGAGGTAAVGGTGGGNTMCPLNTASLGSNGSQYLGGAGGDGSSFSPVNCYDDSSSGGGGGGGGFFGGGGGAGGVDVNPGQFGGGGGGAGSSYVNPAFGIGSFSSATSVAAGSVVISWSDPTPVQSPQTLVGCGAPPKKIAKNGKTRLTAAGCTTNAQQKVSVSASCKLRTRGDVGYCRLVRGKNGSVSIKTYGYAMAVKIRWSAPATGSYKAYQQVKTYKL